MMRYAWSSLLVAACVAGPSGCARPPAAAPPILPEVSEASVSPRARAKLLVAAWPAPLRQSLEKAAAPGAIVVVSASRDSVAVLPDCTLAGDYRYLGARPQQIDLEFHDERELAVNIGHRSAAILPGQRLTSLRVGRLATTRVRAEPGDLLGACHGATHFVRSISVGAVLPSKTAPSTCRGLAPGTTLPPLDCRQFLRVELAPLDNSRFDRGDSSVSFCPRGWRSSPNGCVPKSPGRVFECVDDVPECEAECRLGDLPSCTRLGFIMAHVRPATVATQARASTLYEDSCRSGYPPACYNLGVMSLMDGGGARENRRAVELFRAACDDGYAMACSNLGALQIHAKGALGSLTVGLDALVRSCAGGDPVGCLNAARVSRDADITPEDQVSLYQRACDGDEADGCFEGARLLEALDPKSREVLRLMQRACRAGSSEACSRLQPAGSGV